MLRSPPSRRRGLKSVADTVSNDGDFSRLLRGGVDWNLAAVVLFVWESVASFAEAWIEIKCLASFASYEVSPPSRRRGLKFSFSPNALIFTVASFAEAWIEIPNIFLVRKFHIVASFAEAWIEICKGEIPFQGHSPPPPSRRCGLKYLIVHPTN